MDFKKRYQFDVKKDLVGKGGFAKVFKAFDQVRKRTVALKFYTGTWTNKYDIIGEINRMEDLVHKNLIRYYDATIIESQNVLGEREQIQIGIMEFANAGDFSQFFGKVEINETLILQLLVDILEGLKYLHEQGMAHRDLKPKNILLNNDNGHLVAKIADFGISKKITDSSNTASSQLLGSIEYMAPEQFNSGRYGINGRLATNVDLWSLGVIMHQLMTRRTPFGNRSEGISQEQILNNILFSDMELELEKIADPIRSVIKRCLVKHAGERALAADELLAIIANHGNNTKESDQKLAEDQGVATVVIETDIDLSAGPTFIETVETLKDSKQEGVKTRVFDASDLPQENGQSKQEEKSVKTKVFDPVDPKQIPKVTTRPEPSREPTPEPAKKDYSGVSITQGSKKQQFQSSRVLKSMNLNGSHRSTIERGKEAFQRADYIKSYEHLSPFIDVRELDTEAKFYLGFMIFNGKCGGAHDYALGKVLMEEAKAENRPMVLDLMLKYVLKS